MPCRGFRAGQEAGEGSVTRNPEISAARHASCVVRRRRGSEELAGQREAQRAAATLGAELRRSRRSRNLTLARLAVKVGIGPTRLHELEVGLGASAPLSVWFALGAAVDRPFAAGFSRDVARSGEPSDAGHLAAQELVLRLARRHGRLGLFELSTKNTVREAGNVDVGIRDDRDRALILIEIWNRLDDVGSASRTSKRKTSEVADLAAFREYRVASCWLLVDTVANRGIVRRYPEILRAQFTGSSAEWVRCLTEGQPAPREPGIAWVEPRSGRLTALRFRERT